MTESEITNEVIGLLNKRRTMLNLYLENDLQNRNLENISNKYERIKEVELLIEAIESHFKD